MVFHVSWPPTYSCSSPVSANWHVCGEIAALGKSCFSARHSPQPTKDMPQITFGIEAKNCGGGRRPEASVECSDAAAWSSAFMRPIPVRDSAQNSVGTIRESRTDRRMKVSSTPAPTPGVRADIIAGANNKDSGANSLGTLRPMPTHSRSVTGGVFGLNSKWPANTNSPGTGHHWTGSPSPSGLTRPASADGGAAPSRIPANALPRQSL